MFKNKSGIMFKSKLSIAIIIVKKHIEPFDIVNKVAFYCRLGGFYLV